MADDILRAASSAQPKLQICALCTVPARYKCPRCATPTCSLPCSRKHKQDTRCTGERDKAQYVPMNAYGWGTMMRDYCFLEDIGRKVSGWGNEIVRGGYTTNVSASRAAKTRISSRGRKPTTGKSKRDLLRARLETLGIDVELLPAGMERRNLNQSTFDQKSKSPLLSIEFVFHPPATLASISPSPPLAHKILSHRIGLSATLLSILQRQVPLALSKSQKQKESTPDWLLPMVTPHPEAPECFVPPHCYIRASPEFPCPPNAAYHHKLDPTLNLDELLQKASFVEFPTIHIFDPHASSFFGTVIDKSGSMIRVFDDQINARETKRRKLDKTVGRETVSSLIGGYGSEASSHSEEETTRRYQSGLVTLEAYMGSDDEGTHTNLEEEDQSGSDIDVPDEGDQLDPARLLELVEQAQSAADEDLLDWGDEWDTDAQE